MLVSDTTLCWPMADQLNFRQAVLKLRLTQVHEDYMMTDSKNNIQYKQNDLHFETLVLGKHTTYRERRT